VSASSRSGLVVGLLRIALVVLGSVFFVKITSGLVQGHITYTLGEVVEEQVTTKTFAETFAIWLAFGSLFFAIILAGVRPRLYAEKSWLWKVLLVLGFSGYVLSSILR
jgi:hypothetical protein